jgi:hypothetical protein
MARPAKPAEANFIVGGQLWRNRLFGLANAAPEWQARIFGRRSIELMVACPLEGPVRSVYPKQTTLAVHCINGSTYDSLSHASLLRSTQVPNYSKLLGWGECSDSLFASSYFLDNDWDS